MSNSLLKQSLEFVSGEDKTTKPKTSKLLNSDPRSFGVNRQIKKKKQKPSKLKSSEELIAENLKKLQYLSSQSESILKEKDTEKILDRSLKGKPVIDKIPLATGKDSGTVFTEEDFKKFEAEYFCS